MRTITTHDIYTEVSKLIVEANFYLPGHVQKALLAMFNRETKPLARETLSILLKTAIAMEAMCLCVGLCQ